MERPILIVDPDAEDRDWEADFLDRLEFPVITCGGPRGEALNCPVLWGEECPRHEDVQAIMFQLDLDKKVHRDILARYVDTLDIPIWVACSHEQKDRYADLLRDVMVFEGSIGPAKMDAFAAEVDSHAYD